MFKFGLKTIGNIFGHAILAGGFPNSERLFRQRIWRLHTDKTVLSWRYIRRFSSTEDEISYSQILGDLEQRYSEVKRAASYLRSFVRCASCDWFCYSTWGEKVDSLVLIGAQYKSSKFTDRFSKSYLPLYAKQGFWKYGTIKSSTIKLAHSMRSLDFTLQLNNIRCPVTILCGKRILPI